MKIGVEVGDSTRFAKTVGETDVYLFAGITGDFAANHVNEQAMAETGFGRRFAHGALLVGGRVGHEVELAAAATRSCACCCRVHAPSFPRG